MPQLFFRPKYVWFPVHLKGPTIPDPSGQLAELIVQITSTRVDLYSHQILLNVALELLMEAPVQQPQMLHSLTHCGLGTQYGVVNLGQHWLG